jgi:hypothetical protein
MWRNSLGPTQTNRVGPVDHGKKAIRSRSNDPYPSVFDGLWLNVIDH